MQAGKRWVVERTHAWPNDFGELRRLSDHDRDVIELHTHQGATITMLRRLINEACTRCRWPT